MPTFRCTLFASDKGDVPATLAFTNNYSATTNPGVSNDSTQGYGVGSSWVNTATGTAFQCLDATAGAAVWAIDANGSGLATQGNPTALTTSATLTAAQMLTGILTANQGGAAAAAYQLPLATAMDTALPKSAANQYFDFSLINISTVAAEAASITTNTGWTLVGDMDVQANSAATTKSAGRFRARKTATGAWTLYRLS